MTPNDKRILKSMHRRKPTSQELKDKIKKALEKRK